MTKLSHSRKVALETLISAREHKHFPCDIVHTMCDRNELKSEDRKFCVKLIRGVAGHEVCLDFVLQKFLNSKVSPSVRDALRISAYELLYLNKDSHVAVSQGVELVRSVAKNASGLANAILRKVAEVRLPKDVALRCGFPSELKDCVVDLYGHEKAQDFFKLCDEEPRLQYAVNHLKHEGHLSADENDAVELAKKGEVIIADTSAQEIAKEIAYACARWKSKTLLEVGAGRGTKTALVESFLCEMRHKLEVHDCLDNNKRRLEKLSEKAQLCNFYVHNLFCEDATKATLEKKYDVVFVDAPCTGLGTLRRHPEIKSRLTRSDIRKSAEISLEILKNVSMAVDRNGFLFYSTCTITREENEDVINKFLSSEQGRNFQFERVVRRPILTNSADAHYCVCLKCKM